MALRYSASISFVAETALHQHCALTPSCWCERYATTALAVGIWIVLDLNEQNIYTCE